MNKDRDWLFDKYWNQKLSIKQLAELANCSASTIHYTMIKLNVPRRTISETHEIRWTDERRAAYGEKIKKAHAHGCYGEEWRQKKIEKAKRGPEHPNWKGGKIQVSCEVCGTKFKVDPYIIGRGWGRFCSKKCCGVWQSKNLSGANSHNWQGGKIQVICKMCKKKFEVDPNIVKKGSGKFCSYECHGRWISKNLIGVNSLGWHGGKSFEPYPPAFNEQFKQAIRERDNHTCAICRLAGRDIHHINYVKDDTVPENCITLCKSCHGATGGNREYWQATLSDLMLARNRHGVIVCIQATLEKEYKHAPLAWNH
jgi:hypothetical protein